MQYIGLTKHHVCKSCGLSCTGQELNDYRDKNRPADETAEEEKRKPQKRIPQMVSKQEISSR